MIPETLKSKLKKLHSSHDKKYSVMKKKQHDYEVYSKRVTEIKNIIDYIENSESVKPQILFNQGRDKKYVYGQVYYLTEPQSSKKKSFRFLIGKMSDDKSRLEWESVCVSVFYEKVVKEFV